MHKKSKLFSFIYVLILCLFTIHVNIEAAAHKPVVSGNFEQGQRLFIGEDGSGDDYLFKNGWLKFKHDISSNSYYYVRFEYSQNDFSVVHPYNKQAFDLSLNYTRQITKPLRLKTELGFKNTIYPSVKKKDYRQLAATVELNFKPGKVDEFTCSFKLQEENYPTGDKDNLSGGLNLKWERKVNKQLTVNSSFVLSGENYYDEASLSDRMRQSFSVGFEYQL